MNMLVLGCFFLSGASALIYEVIWIRMLGWLFGTTVLAISAVVTAYMAGLALGSYVGGKWIDRQSRVLHYYCAAEALMGVLGIGLTYLFPHLDFLSIFVTRIVSENWLPLARFGVAFVLLLIPTTLMGATLPMLSRYFSQMESSKARLPGNIVGLLYSINTWGGVVGALLTDFAFIPHFGILMTGTIAGLGNLAIAALVFSRLEYGTQPSQANSRIQVEMRSEPVGVCPQVVGDASLQEIPRWLLLSFSVSGFCALAYEVLWSRILLLFMGSQIFVFSVILSVFLLGIALGAWMVRRYVNGETNPMLLLAIVQALIGAFALFSLLSITRLDQSLPIFSWISSSLWTRYLSQNFAAAFLVVFPSAILMGATFPIYVRIVSNRKSIGQFVGKLYAYNTVGSAVGSFAAGFFLLPRLGLQSSMIVLSSLNVLLATQAIFKSNVSMIPKTLSALPVFAVIVIGVLLPRNFVLSRTYERHFGPLDFFSEDPEGTVGVARLIDFDGTPFRRLVINGVSMTGTTFKSQRYMKLLGHLPSLIHPHPERALVIGLGTGMTLSSIVAHPEFKTIECAELSPAVRDALPLFDEVNNQAWKDSRVHLIFDDGRHYLMTTPNRYDVITFEPPPPRNVGAVNLYSEDYYRICKRHLNSHGLVSQWLPVHQMTREDVRSAIKAFVNVFPSTTLWTNFAYLDLCLVGSPDPIRVETSLVRDRMRNAFLSAEFARIGIDGPESLLATFLKSDGALRAYTKNSRPVTDDRPILEYSFPIGMDVDFKWLFGERESIQSLLVSPLNEVKLSVQEQFHDAIQAYVSHGWSVQTGDWKQDLLGDTIADIALDNAYARYLLDVTDNAKKLLDERLSKNADEGNSLLRRGRWFRLRHQWEDATRDYEHYLLKDPHYDYALFSLGIVELRQGKRSSAMRDFKEAAQRTNDPELKQEALRRMTPLGVIPKS